MVFKSYQNYQNTAKYNHQASKCIYAYIVQFQGELWESPGRVGLEWTGSKGREMNTTCDYFKLNVLSW